MANIFLKVDKDLFKLGLNPTEILIYAQVIEFDTNTKDCFMSDKAFAEMLGVSDRTVSRALANLEEKGLITRETKNVKSGKERHIKVTKRQNVSCESTNDKLSYVQETNCLMDKGQIVLIKDNVKDNIIKDNTKSIGTSPISFKTKREIKKENSFVF